MVTPEQQQIINESFDNIERLKGLVPREVTDDTTPRAAPTSAVQRYVEDQLEAMRRHVADQVEATLKAMAENVMQERRATATAIRQLRNELRASCKIGKVKRK